MSRTLQTSTVYFSRVSYLFECNANDTYVLRMTHILLLLLLLPPDQLQLRVVSSSTSLSSSSRPDRSYGGVQKVCTTNGTSLRRRFSCNTIVTNVEVQDTDFLDTAISSCASLLLLPSLPAGCVQKRGQWENTENVTLQNRLISIIIPSF